MASIALPFLLGSFIVGFFLSTHVGATAEERMLAGGKLEIHRMKLFTHFAKTWGLDSSQAQVLVRHMEQGRLSLWDPEDKGALKDQYIVSYKEDCKKDGDVDHHVRAVEAIVCESSNFPIAAVSEFSFLLWKWTLSCKTSRKHVLL